MDNLSRLGSEFSVSIPPDEDGLTGRECPASDCQGYFKVKFGTGLKGKGLPCYCPYCGHVESHNKFFTQDQIEYVRSVAFNKITGAIIKDLKQMEFNHPPRGAFGIGISLKFEGRPHPIRYYREKQLETLVVCDHCTLRYAVYGVFAFCPDCGVHNSLQILNKNLELAEKEVNLASTVEGELAGHLIGDALENAVSAFDGFGREICKVSAHLSTAPSRAEGISFQNLTNSMERMKYFFGFDISACLEPEEWKFTCRCFQKRHLLAHKMGVIDEAYIRATEDPQAVIGRKILITPEEVSTLIVALKKLGARIFYDLAGKI